MSDEQHSFANEVSAISAAVIAAIALLFCPATHAAPPSTTTTKLLSDDAGPTGQIYIYKDLVSQRNRGYRTNMMAPSGISPADLISNFSLGDTVHPYGGIGEAIRIDFELGPLQWAGVAVASSPNCWGKTPCPIVYTDLKSATRLVFHARGERGGEIMEAKVAITGQEQFGDSAFTPAASTLIQLTDQWQRYVINLRQTDLSRIITPFAVFVSRASNDKSVTIFLDEIHFEFSK